MKIASAEVSGAIDAGELLEIYTSPACPSEDKTTTTNSTSDIERFIAPSPSSILESFSRKGKIDSDSAVAQSAKLSPWQAQYIFCLFVNVFAVGACIMQLGDRLGLVGIVLALIAIAVSVLWPDRKWIGWISLVCAVCLLAAWGWVEFGRQLPIMRSEYPIASAIVVFLVGGCLMLALWLLVAPRTELAAAPPLPAPATTNPQPDKPTAALLYLDSIFGFTEQNTIAPGERLGFRFFYKNGSSLLISNVRSSLAASVAMPSLERALVQQFQATGDAALANKVQVKAPDVSPGMSTYFDFSTQPLATDQAKGLLDGSMRLYFYLHVIWDGSDGLKGDSEACLWLPTPHSKTLTADIFKHWNTCLLPVRAKSNVQAY